ncbi:MAG: hypothetical protein ACYC8T_37890 [Myxococcaceae bacterium]
MAGIFERSPNKRWPRSQRFQLSAKGSEAEASYREVIVAARAEEGRQSFDAARAAWAAKLTLDPTDGLYLGELQNGPRTIEEITRALETCGSTRQEVHVAIDRLTGAGMMEAVAPPPPPAPAAPAPRRW